MSDILGRIVETKKEEIAVARGIRPLKDLEKAISLLPPSRSLLSAIRQPFITVIAEVKKASPSAGVLVKNFDHRQLSRDYSAAGAAALSVLTDKTYFQGDLVFLSDIRHLVDRPLLRKDFIVDEYQVFETRIAGGDALLLIARILETQQLRHLVEIAESIGLEVLVEVHEKTDIEKAVSAGATLMGINNRDLSDFSVSLERSFELRRFIDPGVTVVSESGIRKREEVRKLQEAGFQAVLVGESLVRGDKPGEAIKSLLQD